MTDDDPRPILLGPSLIANEILRLAVEGGQRGAAEGLLLPEHLLKDIDAFSSQVLQPILTRLSGEPKKGLLKGDWASLVAMDGVTASVAVVGDRLTVNVYGEYVPYKPTPQEAEEFMTAFYAPAYRVRH